MIAQGDATNYYYYWDLDGDGLPGGNYGNICVEAGEEDSQTALYNGVTSDLVTCGANGLSNGTCDDTTTPERDIDDTCNGCETGACSDNTAGDLYDACGTCNGLYTTDIDDDGIIAFDYDDCIIDCSGIAQGDATNYYYYWDLDLSLIHI